MYKEVVRENVRKLEAYVEEWNKRLPESLPDRHLREMGVCQDLKARWQNVVRNKEKRIGIKLPKEKYETRFRIKGWGDPRSLENREV